MHPIFYLLQDGLWLGCLGLGPQQASDEDCRSCGLKMSVRSHRLQILQVLLNQTSANVSQSSKAVIESSIKLLHAGSIPWVKILISEHCYVPISNPGCTKP